MTSRNERGIFIRALLHASPAECSLAARHRRRKNRLVPPVRLQAQALEASRAPQPEGPSVQPLPVLPARQLARRSAALRAKPPGLPPATPPRGT